MTKTEEQNRAQLAKDYGMVSNPEWFQRRIAEHLRTGNRQQAEVTLAIAERHNITVPCGSMRGGK